MTQFPNAGVSQDVLAYDDLIAGHFPLVSRKVTILSGQVLTRGALLGRITASGKYISSLAAAVDGSEAPSVILVDDVDATAGDKTAQVYLTGEFNQAAVVYGTGHTADSVREALRALSIFLKPVMEN